MDDKIIYNRVKQAVEELITVAKLEQGDLLVVGCSSSEITGSKIGTYSKPETAAAVFSAIYDLIKDKGIFLAAQCCEHLNRAIVIEKAFAKAHNLETVNVVPQPKAGGSFAVAAYKGFEHPVVVEEITADAGLDIGGTLIGMHLKKVAVPVRLSVNKIGQAMLLAARTRPKFIGGERAVYDQSIS